MKNLRNISQFATGLVSTALFALVATLANAQALKSFVVTEPVHSLDSLPFYLAIEKGYFKDIGLDVEILTTEGGGRHMAAVLSGDAQAFIGGPEHLAYAKAKGGRDIRAVASMSNRANAYLVPAKSLEVPGGSLGNKLKGKRIAVSTRGGTPHSIMLYLLAREKLDSRKDVTLLEIASSGGRLAAVKAGQADIAMLSEPLITQGVKQGVFAAPFLGMPQELGPLVWTTVNVPADLINKDPQLIQGLVDGLKKGLDRAFTNRAEIEKLAEREFPNVKKEDLKAVLDRALSENLWERSAAMPKEAWATLHTVVRQAGLLDRDMPYESIFEPSFVK